MEYNFLLYYDKENGMPCVEVEEDDGTINIRKANNLSCSVHIFGVHYDRNGKKSWAVAGMSESIEIINNTITIRQYGYS